MALAAGGLALASTVVGLRGYPFRYFAIDASAAAVISALVLYGPFVTPEKWRGDSEGAEGLAYLGLLSPMAVVLAAEALQDHRRFSRDGNAQVGVLAGWSAACLLSVIAIRFVLPEPRLGHESESEKFAEGLADTGSLAVGLSALTAAGWAVSARRR